MVKFLKTKNQRIFTNEILNNKWYNLKLVIAKLKNKQQA